MRFIGQVWLGLLFCLGLFAQDDPAFEFDAPVMKESLFKEGLGLLDRERDEYATSLATFAANYVREHEANPESLDFSKRAIGLAMHLSSRNRKMMILKHQLSKGIMPQEVEAEYSPKTLAALFVTRAETLFEQKGVQNILLARALIDMAATVDPMNEDAVYAYELQKIDYGELDWKQFTEVTKVTVPTF
jgi:hypothetical protein